MHIYYHFCWLEDFLKHNGGVPDEIQRNWEIVRKSLRNTIYFLSLLFWLGAKYIWKKSVGEASLEFVVNLSSKDGAKIEKQQMGWEAIHCWGQLIGAESDPGEQIWQQVGSYHRPTRASLPLWRRVVERKPFQPKLTFNLFLLQGEVLREVVLNGGDDRLWKKVVWFWFDGRSRDKGDFFGNRIFQEKVFSTEI